MIEKKDYRGEELRAFRCTRCAGSGKVVVNWDAYNNIQPGGLSEAAWARHAEMVRRAFGPCSACNGKGIIFNAKESM